VLKEKIQDVRDRMERASARSGRNASGITLLAVTKKFPAALVREAWEAGLREFGENYVQEFEEKYPLLTDLEGARFHLIGHLQSNKTSVASRLFDVIETVDTPKLARRLDAAAKPLDVMLEVKLSEEGSKAGAAPESLAELVAAVRECGHLRLRGLMTMPPWSDDPEQSRPYFVRLRELAAAHGLEQLSMGMSQDLEVAIEEGATLVRVGTGLFGPRKKA
jgi:pyridoxal phosphate enzyme (YggS family)